MLGGGGPSGPLILFLVQLKDNTAPEYNKSSYATVAYNINFIIIYIFYGPIDNL